MWPKYTVGRKKVSNKCCAGLPSLWQVALLLVAAGGQECFAEGGGIGGVEFGVAASGADCGRERTLDWFFVKGGSRVLEGDEFETLVGV